MKIDLNKDEWIWLKKYLESENDFPLIDHDFTKTWAIIEKLIKKLGNEWEDENPI